MYAIYATTDVEHDYKGYDRKTAAELADIDTRLDTLRNLYGWADKEGKSELQEQARELQEQRIAKQFRLNRSAGEDIAERNFIGRIDAGYEDFRLAKEPNLAPVQGATEVSNGLPQSDSEWLSWKIEKFISNIAYRNKQGHLFLRAGRKSIRIGGNGQYVSFMCYGCQHFNGSHYVGGNAKQAQLILARVLAHTYKH